MQKRKISGKKRNLPKGTIVISKPNVKKSNGLCRVTSKLILQDREYDFFYEIEEKYEKYLTIERSDPFVLAVLEYAMWKNLDIVSDMPISEDLYYKLTRIYIPIMDREFDENYPIELKIPYTDEKIESLEHGVATALSRGIDSYYSVIRNLGENATPKYRITHLLTCNVGALGFMGGERSKAIFDDMNRKNIKVCERLGVEYVTVHSNSMEFYDKAPHALKGAGALKNGACVFLLRKLFDIYYYSSGVPADQFYFSWEDEAYYDLLTLPCISVDGLTFITTGSELERLDKLGYIIDNPVVQDSMQVCWEEENCGKCWKCRRTELEIYSYGKLDKFRKVFNVDLYNNNKSRLIGETLGDPHERVFYKRAVQNAKKNNVKIPFSAWLYGFMFFRPIEVLKKVTKHNQVLAGIYHKLYYFRYK